MILNKATQTITRPADVIAYAAGDLIANSTTQGDVVPMEFANITNTSLGSGYLVKAMCFVQGAAFDTALRLHLFTEAPAVVADNAPYPFLISEQSKYIGFVEFTDFSSSGSGSDAAISLLGAERLALMSKDLTGSNPIFGLLEARAIFTPTSGQTFTVELTVDAYEA